MKRKFNIAALTATLIISALGGGCKNTAEDNRPVLTVSIEPQRCLLEQIVGDHFRVISIMSNSENPETFEPSISRRMDVDKSKAYFTVGLLPFEAGLSVSTNPGLRIVNTSVDIEPVYGTHTHKQAGSHTNFLQPAHQAEEEHTEAPDPHVWASVKNARKIARTMATNIMRIDPKHAAEYQKNYEKLDQHLDSLDKAFESRLESKKGRPFLIWHPSLSYFARDYGLEQRSVAHEAKEISATQLADLIEQAKADSIKVFFYQRKYDSRQAATVSEGAGAKLVPINPGNYDWETELTTIVNEIEQR